MNVAIASNSFRRYVPMLASVGLLIVLVFAVVMLINFFMSSSDEPKKRRVQQISLIKPPEPPPPEVKPPEEKPPENKEEIPPDQPPPEAVQSDAPPPAGIGGSGYGGGDTSFGGSGGWIGGSNRFGFYLGGLQQGIHDELNRNEKLRRGEYKVVVALWIGKNGIVNRCELLGSSGDKELDVLMKKALFGVKFEEPPSDIPQPIRLRISSR
jgi:TonB family protein